MRYRPALVALLASLASGASAAAQTLTPYDVFVFNSFTLSNTETNGRIAIGGNATFTDWRVGHRLPPGFTDYSLVVGGDFTSTRGSVSEGKTFVGGTSSITQTGFPAAYPTPFGGTPPIDFMSEMIRLTNISDAYAAMATTGSTQLVNGGELNFIGNGNYNVFSLTIAELQTGTAGYQFVTPVGATNIVNVLGSSSSSAFNNTAYFFDCTQIATSSSCQTGAQDNTPAAARLTLFNFNGQTSLSLGGPVHGSILAPRAAVTFGYGDVVGTVIVNSGVANAEFYDDHDFQGAVTATPEPATMGLVALGLLGIGAVRRRRMK